MRTSPLNLLFYIFGALVETLLLRFFSRRFLKLNKQRKKYIIFAQAAYFLYQFFTYFFQFPLFSSAPLTYLLAIGITSLFYEDSAYFRAMAIHLFIVLNYGCRLLALSVAIVTHTQIVPEHRLPVLGIGVQLFSYGLVAMFILVMTRLQKKRQDSSSPNHSLLMVALPAFYLISLAFLVGFKFYEFNNDVLYFLCFSVCLLTLAFTIFYYLDQLIVIDRTTHYITLTQEILEVNKQHYAEIMKSQEELLRLKHDFLKHLNTLHNYVGTGHTKEAEVYLSQLLRHPLYQKQTVRTSNTTVDSILNQSLARLSQEGIALDYQVMIPPVLPFEDVDLCIILANLMSNATEACLKLSEEERKDAKIHLRIMQKKGFLYIEIQNNYSGQIRMENGLFLSSKRNMENPGIGISNIQATVEKYDGVMKIVHKDSVFRVQIIMPLNNQVAIQEGLS